MIDIFHGPDLQPGHSVEGPALIEEATTTVLIGHGDRLTVDRANNFVVEFTDRIPTA